MRIAVANSDFSVSLIDKSAQAIRSYQVANGEDLKTVSKRMTGVVKLEGVAVNGLITGYLVEIEEQVVFIDERLMEVSK